MQDYLNSKLKITKQLLLMVLLLFNVACDGASFPNLLNETAEEEPFFEPVQYTLAEEEVQSWPEQILPLNNESQVAGELGQSGGLLKDGTPIDAYEFNGTIGELAEISLQSDAFDTYLIVVDQRGRIILTNDDLDPKNGTDSRLEFYLPMTGSYQVLVNSNAGKVGSYDLNLQLSLPEEGNRLAMGETVQGILKPGDSRSENGSFMDEWMFTLPEYPVVIFMRSDEFDTYLTAVLADGTEVERNDDENFVGRVGNSRLYIEPSESVPAGTTLTLQASMPTPLAVGGDYELKAVPFPESWDTPAKLLIKPVLVTPSGYDVDMERIETGWHDVLAYTQATWESCNISIETLGTEIEHVILDDFPNSIQVRDGEWSADEELLQQLDVRTFPYDGVVTAYIVPQLDDGRLYGVSYPSTRYPPRRSGLLIIAENTLTEPEHFVTLGHEIGHMLGLEHPNAIDGDGDPFNDRSDNVMSTDLHTGGVLAITNLAVVSPLQCLSARATHHYLQADAPLLDDVFTRVERVLVPGERIRDALTTQDEVTLSDSFEYYLDVFHFRGLTGERFEIELTSSDFDPYLVVQNSEGQVIAEIDDYEGSRDALVQIILPEEGDYSIGVTSYLPVERGSYELELRRPQ